MTVEAVLFDFGGTLDAPGIHWSTRLFRSFRAAGVDRPRAEVDRAFFASEEGLAADPATAGLGLDAYVRRQADLMAAHLGVAGAAAASAAARFVLASREHIARSRAALAARRRQVRLGLVSNFYANLPRILDEEGLAPLLDAVVVSEIAGVAKPDPAIFRLALDALGVAPARAAMVGDSLRSDVMAAREAGLTAVWVRGDEVFGGGDPAAAHHVAADVAAALAWLAPGVAPRAACGGAP